MSKLKFNTNNGDTQVWEQDTDDGEVKIFNLLQDWKKERTPMCVPAGDMVMLANLYRYIKRCDIADAFVNSDGTRGMAVDCIAEAVAKQTPMKPLMDKELFPDGIRYSEDYICPSCGRGFTGTGIADFCYHCGQALDWSDEE